MGTQKKILIVEDDTDFRNNLRDLLVREGYEILATENGEQAIEEIISNKPNLILLDILLPGIGGLDVLKRTREYPDELVARIPVIIISNYSKQSDLAEANKYKIEAYFVKSHTSPETVVRQIEAVLGPKTDSGYASHDFSQVKYYQ